MTRTINIDPVTRIEGHARVFLDLDDNGGVQAAGLVVNELRGFERILVGMEADSMPQITARICGVCPTAHHLAAVKALDAAVGVQIPPAAKLLRELLYMGHFIHSHALSLFVLQGPDLVFGYDTDPAQRNVMGLVAAVPEVAKKAIRLRTLGQKINELVGGRGIHPVTAVVGGIAFELDGDKQSRLESWASEATRLACDLAPIARTLLLKLVEKHPELMSKWSVKTNYMGTLQNESSNFYDGQLRVIKDSGEPLLQFQSQDYYKYMQETSLDYSYLKPVGLHLDGEAMAYRVGSLARVNCADSMATALANRELGEFRKQLGRPCHLTVMQIWARLIELIYACERAEELLRMPEIRGQTRVPIRFRAGRGIGHVEAPRGVLIHDYEVDDEGIVRKANLVVATQQNYSSINDSIKQAAEGFSSKTGDDAVLGGIEFAIRCYDPCLSCATHAVGEMPLEVVFRRGPEHIRVVRR